MKTTEYRKIVPLAAALAVCIQAGAAHPSGTTGSGVVLLWPGGAPLAVGSEEVNRPKLTVYPSEATSIERNCRDRLPRRRLWGPGRRSRRKTSGEMAQLARRHGVHPEVPARASLPSPGSSPGRSATVRTVRARAGEWKIDAGGIGLWGFSAGGHLASTAGTHFDSGMADSSDPIERMSSRPDFLILSYPVVTMKRPTPIPARGITCSERRLTPNSWKACRTRRKLRRRLRQHFSCTRTRTRPSRLKTACCSTWRCARPGSLRRFTFTKKVATASAWRRKTRSYRPGPMLWPRG